MFYIHRPNPEKLILMNELIHVYGMKCVVGWCPLFHTKFRDKLVTMPMSLATNSIRN